MLDDFSVIVAHGTGKHAAAVPEMTALAARFGFAFAAPARGDAKRSARVEVRAVASRGRRNDLPRSRSASSQAA